jgi:phage tail tape-measure protein
MSSSTLEWIDYFEAALLLCCKTASWEYQASIRHTMPSYAEYENAVIEHVDGLKKARQSEYQENKQVIEHIELAAKNVIDRIRHGDEEFTRTLGESYEELKRLFMLSPQKYIV